MSSEIKTNTISEVTSANGVSIDGLKVKDSALVTDTNKYTALKTGELNSKGFIKNNAFCFNYYVSANNGVSNSSWTEMGGSASGMNMGWTVQPTTGTTGSTNADQFGKFDTTTGRFTPTISGFYALILWAGFTGDLGDGTTLQAVMTRNGHTVTSKPDLVGYFRRGIRTTTNPGIFIQGVMSLDTNDYVSNWVWHNHGSSSNLGTGRFSGFYLGENL